MKTVFSSFGENERVNGDSFVRNLAKLKDETEGV